MKTIEEKAKRYDEALEAVKNLREINPSDEGIQNWVNENFPELKESEGEKIRKVLIGWINLEPSTSFNGTFDGFSKEQILAWLEKQGNTNIFDVPKISIKNAVEVTSRMQYIDDDMKPIAEFIMNYANWNLHKDEWNHPTLTVPLFRVLDALIQKGKPYCECNQNIEKQGEHNHADKVEPKFKVGDWCIDNEDGLIFQIVKVLDNTYRYRTNEGKEYSCTHYSLELDARLWTIQDAKDGDVLVASDGSVFLFAGVVDCACKYYAALATDDYVKINKEAKGGYWETSRAVYPATKEQRDKLEKEMADAGYVFDFEKKELKEIEK